MVKKFHKKYKRPKISYADKLFTIHSYVTYGSDKRFDYRRDLDKTLTRAEKNMITRDYNIIRPLLARDNHIYRPRTMDLQKREERLRAAQRFGQHRRYSRTIKVAFVDKPLETDHFQLNFRKGGAVTLTMDYVEQTFVAFDPKLLVKKPREHVNTLLEDNPAEKGKERFKLIYEEFLDSQTHSRESLPDALLIALGLYRADVIRGFMIMRSRNQRALTKLENLRHKRAIEKNPSKRKIRGKAKPKTKTKTKRKRPPSN